MIYDYYASLSKGSNLFKGNGLASGYVDECTVHLKDKKNKIREDYRKHVSGLGNLKLPDGLNFSPDFSKLPEDSWLGIEVKFELLSPWYSKDDRPFHVMDNPVRKDKVFGVPFMSSSTWKGLLRWACRMEEGLLSHLQKNKMTMNGWEDPAWIVHLFGNERTEEKDSNLCGGALNFYATCFDRIGFEVINPHKRSTRAGSQPIYYEVVPTETKGKLQVLYVPVPGKIENDGVNQADAIANLLKAIKVLLENYGISAKRTSGWGAVRVDSVEIHFVEGSWFKDSVASVNKAEYTPPEEKFKELLDENGYPIQILKDKAGDPLSSTKFKKLGDRKPNCTLKEYQSFCHWYENHGEDYRKQINGIESTSLPKTTKRSFKSLAEPISMLTSAKKGGV